ncbi:MAG: hypothetical protein LCH73_05350 [Proteobacteria bacterium]|nr:hypothetical protein [Pseudomonadota bacterium]
MRARNRLRWLLATALCGMTLAAQAEVYLVVAANSPVQSLTRKDAINLYTGRTRQLASGQMVQALDLPRDDALRGEMYWLLTGQTLAQVNSYWSRLTFTGQTRALPTSGSEAEVIETLRNNPLALGYVSREPVNRGLRVVLVLKE